MPQRSILCMQGTQYATKRSILCRGAFCGSTTVDFFCTHNIVFADSSEVCSGIVILGLVL